MFGQDYLLNRLYVKGEVSNCKYHTSGHVYFSLKDETGAIACVMFASQRSNMKFRLAEGQKVIVLGSVKVYERDGKYQLYANEIVLDGIGLLYERFQALKKELEEGVLAMLGIPAFLHTPVYKMSGGMKKRLIIGCAVAHNPSVLLLDEPSAALDLVCKERIYNYIMEMEKCGNTVILATHDVQEIAFCDALYILKNGVLEPYHYDGNIHKLVGML
jgi:exodeoxyribonuclease VII large subunit